MRIFIAGLVGIGAGWALMSSLIPWKEIKEEIIAEEKAKKAENRYKNSGEE
jgi:hypothetical protein